MFGSALDKVAGYLNNRFLLNAFFPSLAFWGLLLLLLVVRIGWSAALGWWAWLGLETQIVLAIIALAWLVVFASVLAVWTGTLLRWYEGYWGGRGPGRWLAELCTKYYRRRLRLLNPDNDRDLEFRYRRMPRKQEAVMPTALGNVLKCCETYPGDDGRYGLDAVFFWPRLYAVLPDTMRADLADARSALDFLVVVSALSVLFGAIAAIFFGSTGGYDGIAWLMIVGSAFLGWFTYTSAVRATVVYAELVKSAFDIYRLDLLKQMGLAAPESLDDERVLWKNLGQQLYRRGASDPAVLKYAKSDNSQ